MCALSFFLRSRMVLLLRCWVREGKDDGTGAAQEQEATGEGAEDVKLRVCW